MQETRDLVCGMMIPVTANRSEYKGKVYCFCCKDCKEAFDKDPEKYLKADNPALTRPWPEK